MHLWDAKLVLVGVIATTVSLASCRSPVTRDDLVKQNVQYMCQISGWGSDYDSVAPTVYMATGTLDMTAVPYVVDCLNRLPRPEAGSEKELDWAWKIAVLTSALRFSGSGYLDGLVNWLWQCREQYNKPVPYEDVAEVRERLLERFGYLLGIREVDETKRKRIKDLMSSLTNETVSVPWHNIGGGAIFIENYYITSAELAFLRNAEEFYKSLDCTPHPLIQQGGAALPLLLEAIRQNEHSLKEILIANAILCRGGPIEAFLFREPHLLPPGCPSTAPLQRQPPDFLLQLERTRLINLLEAFERFRQKSSSKKR